MNTTGSWGVIQQNFPDSSWGAESPANRPNNIQVDSSWEKAQSSGTWADRTSAPTPSENNLSAKKNAHGSWGPNKSENSWVFKNEPVQVDKSWQTRRQEPALSESGYKKIKRENEDEKLDVGIQQSFETLRNGDYDRQHMVLDEDDYDPSYESYPTSSKPQLGKSVASPFDDDIQFNTSDSLDVYKANSRVEFTSSNSTFQESPNKELRSVGVQTDPIDVSSIIASREKLLSITIGSQQTGRDLPKSTTNNVSENRYPPQQSLLDVDPEEFNTKARPWNTSSDGNPNFREGTAATPPTKPDTNSRSERSTTAALSNPNSDSWDSKPQNDSWNTSQRGPATQSIPQTSARNDNRSTIPQIIPVEPDSWDAPPQTSTRNVPISRSTSQTSARDDNRGTIPQIIPVEPDSWDAPPQTSTRNVPISQSASQTSARNDNRGTIPQIIPVEPDSWDAPPQTSTTNVPTTQSTQQTSARNDNRGTIPLQIPVESDSWDSPAQNDRGSAFQPAPNWGNVSQPTQSNSWNSSQQQSQPKDTIPQEGPKGSGTVQQNETKEWGTPANRQQTGDTWSTSANNNNDDWKKRAEMFAKELGDSENKAPQWEQTNSAEPKGEDSYVTGASDSYYDNSSNNRYSRTCRSCGGEGHLARDCPDKKQGGRTCHKCGKEGHMARDCTEESVRVGYGGGKSCHKCGKEGHIARDCREDAYEATGEGGSYSYGSNSGLPRPHTKASPFSNPQPSDISSQDAWEKLLKADGEQDVDDFKEALELYAKATPEETFVSIEKKLRSANCNGRIIALDRSEIPLTKVLVDLQGNANKKYVARVIMGPASRLPRTSGNRAENDDENLIWLNDSGFMVDDHTPVCFNCKQKGHITKECPEPKREIEKQSYLTCQHCNSSEHLSKHCPEERRDFYTEARDRKVAGGYKSEYSTNEDRAFSGHDGEDDRKGYRGYGSNSSKTCYNCNREGHMSRDCPEQKRGGGASSGYDGEDDRKGYRGYNNGNLTCHNCNGEGHLARDCTEQRRGRKCHKCGEEGHMSKDCNGSSGGSYDRGNYNSSHEWQRDPSSRNNDRTATWDAQDNTWGKARSDNTTLGPRENSLNKPSGGDSSRGDHNNAQNKGENDTYSNYSNDNTLRDSSRYNQNKNDTSQQKDNKPDFTPIKVESDSWDAQPKTENTAGWGHKTAADFGWSSDNKTSAPEDNENRQGRGNEQRERTFDSYENRRSRGDDQRERYENRRGRGNDQRENYGNYENYENRGGRGDDQRERSYENRRERSYENRRNYENYENRGNRGNDQRDRPDNRWGRGNDQRERSYENRRNYENYENRGNRGNDQRDRSENYDNRRSRGNDKYSRGSDHDRYSSRAQSNDANNQKPNLDEQTPWW